MSTIDHQVLAAAVERLRALELAACFDPNRPGSRATPSQQAVLDDLGKVNAQYLTAGNQSGKSQLGSRIISGIFQENFPGWKRPARWGTESLLLIVVARTTKQAEEVLWRKIKSFLKEGEYKEVRVGNALQKVVNTKNGNTILFASHHNENEAREKLQAFVAHVVWIDEMPGSANLFEELQRRVQANAGFFLATFTPKSRNIEIRRIVDSAQPPFAKKYTFKMFDNPIYTEEDKVKILQSLEGYPESYINCVLNGDWLDDDFAVYSIDPSRMIQEPVNYSAGWRHVESADPALQSKHGQVVFAQCPATNFWYVVRADYLVGILNPEDLVRAATARVSHFNIVRRVCDSASTWYIGQASKMGFTYTTPWDKNNRRSEMMKNAQRRLGVDLFIAPWCGDLTDELSNMQWSETAKDKVVNSHTYHLHDAFIYGIDCLPRDQVAKPTPEWHVQLRIWQEQQRAREAALARKKSGIRLRRSKWR